ncbi:hypothetical protein PUNSTDRAFT_134086 [Punctularia strigosozonata HHB-11173 SS5]|uniref:uncharacterized protein n=1 Tax=Punctularia strigosozonata (strain HHB-11173) TaxID=741275 RepID=UPI0004417DF4|nr:uncharacterized protein PUNSTDRAFT_134086 [Punctularia strigosozonata HHB-11173 SS5]EIN08912.1 hypothetical protein PUNSTDRAFT_134086 [Punctularia strigosozonata HHB-11173 SS5]
MADPLAEAIALKKAASIPLYVSVVSLTWVLHDYILTVRDEARYIWPGKWNLGKFLFFWVRYYTIALALFDVAQIHSFATFQPSLTTCVVMDAMIRVVGALSLWAIEIVMQLRIYAIFRCSKPVAIVNIVLFLASVGGFMWILVHNALGRAAVIKTAKALPIPGCPVVHTGIEWAQWVPATAYEGVLFLFALFKTASRYVKDLRSQGARRTHTKKTLYNLMLQDNLLYFFGIACILVFNNLMVVNVTHIPWFSYGPFHAVTGIMTCRMLIHLRKALAEGPMVSGVSVVSASRGIAFAPGTSRATSTGQYGSETEEEVQLGLYSTSQTLLFAKGKTSTFGSSDASTESSPCVAYSPPKPFSNLDSIITRYRVC